MMPGTLLTKAGRCHTHVVNVDRRRAANAQGPRLADELKRPFPATTHPKLNCISPTASRRR